MTTEFPARHRKEIDLGLAISGALLKPGERRTLEELSAFCGCRKNVFQELEINALKKLRRRIQFTKEELALFAK